MSGDHADTGQRDAQAALSDLLATAARRLSGLDQPVVVAACPNKFDDTGRYPDWLGVQVGCAIWERAWYRHDVIGAGDMIDENARHRADVQPAVAVLTRLQSAAWRPLVERALGIKLWDEVLAVVVQHGATWFLVSASNMGTDIAFRIGASGKLERVGVAERLDQRLGRARPLLLERIDPTAWPSLRAAVPAFPTEWPMRQRAADAQEAHARLVELLRNAFSKLRAIAGNVRYVAAAQSDPVWEGFSARRWRTVTLDDFYAVCNDMVDTGEYVVRLREHSAAAEALDQVLDELEAGKWRDLFAAGVMPLGRQEPIGLLVRGLDEWLIAAQSAVLALTPEDGLDLVGACDRITWAREPARAAIHLFDGRSLVPSDLLRKGWPA